MSERWRQSGKMLYRYGRRVVPVLISAGLLGWLIWKVTPEKLLWALSFDSWPWLVALTFAQVIVLFLWDTVCLWWLFSQPDQPLPFRMVLRARTDSVLWSAVNLEIGQAVFAAKLADRVKEPLTAALGRCLLLAMFDTGTLTSLGVIGSFVNPDPVTWYFRWPCLGIALGLLALGLLLRYLPERAQRWLKGKEWASWLVWMNWRRAIRLVLFRLVLFLLMLLYVGIGLAICHMPSTPTTVIGVVPFVLLAESLPGTGGIGERETALVYLLGATGEQRAELLSFGLIWSAGVIVGRVLIGLGSAWLPRRNEPVPTASDESPSPRMAVRELPRETLPHG